MTADPGLTAPGTAELAALVFTRVTGAVAAAPLLSSIAVPRLVRVGVVATLTMLITGALRGTVAGIPTVSAATLATEVVAGFTIGFAAAVLIAAAEAAGDVMSIQAGLSGAALLDPLDQSSTLVLGAFSRLFAVTLLLSTGLFEVMLGALARSFDAVPPGTALASATSFSTLAGAGTLLFASGLQFAAPVIVAGLGVTLALAILTRAAPQLNAFAVAFPAQIGAGLIAAGAACVGMGRMLTHWALPYGDIVARAFAAMRTAGVP